MMFLFIQIKDGKPSRPIICRTDESTPEAPEKIKSVNTGENSAIISWLPPQKPNGSKF
jgi:hypothetical protein